MKVYRKSNKELDIFNPSPAKSKFSMVGIGGAGGGLRALRAFFSYLPASTGTDFVAALLRLAKLLQMVPSSHPVAIRQDHVYAIALPSDVVMFDGHLSPVQSRRVVAGRHGAVDLLFRTLAKAQGKMSMAMPFSGAGSDGASGIKHIRDAGGAVAVQSSTETSVPEMLPAAIAANHVDLILPVHDVAGFLGYLNALSTWRGAVCHRLQQRQPIRMPRRCRKANQPWRLIHHMQPFERQVLRRAEAISSTGVVSCLASTISKWQAVKVDPQQAQRSSSLPTRSFWSAEAINAASGRANASRSQALFGIDGASAFKRCGVHGSRVAGKALNGYLMAGHHPDAWFAGMESRRESGLLQPAPLMTQPVQGDAAETNKLPQYVVADFEMLPVTLALGAVHVEDLIANVHVLTTINRELRTRIEGARLVNNDLNNLVHSTHAVASFVSTRMQIKMMTPQAQALFDLDQKDHHVLRQQ